MLACCFYRSETPPARSRPRRHHRTAASPSAPFHDSPNAARPNTIRDRDLDAGEDPDHGPARRAPHIRLGGAKRLAHSGLRSSAPLYARVLFQTPEAGRRSVRGRHKERSGVEGRKSARPGSPWTPTESRRP